MSLVCVYHPSRRTFQLTSLSTVDPDTHSFPLEASSLQHLKDADATNYYWPICIYSGETFKFPNNAPIIDGRRSVNVEDPTTFAVVIFESPVKSELLSFQSSSFIVAVSSLMEINYRSSRYAG